MVAVGNMVAVVAVGNMVAVVAVGNMVAVVAVGNMVAVVSTYFGMCNIKGKVYVCVTVPVRRCMEGCVCVCVCVTVPVRRCMEGCVCVCCIMVTYANFLTLFRAHPLSERAI